MWAERLHVAVRPRGILECLDLAVLFCGRHLPALALATALGALPWVLLDDYLIDQFHVRVLRLDGRARVSFALDAVSFLVFALLMMAWDSMQAAWASVPLTLYLAQAVCAERFRWGLAARALLRSLPALVFFQGIFRAVCTVTVVFAPVVFIGMYYLNQVVLVERPRCRRIWGRRRALNRGIEVRIFLLVLLECLLLTVGVSVVENLLGAVSALWHGRSVSWQPPFVRFGRSRGSVAVRFAYEWPTWHSLIAFWSVSGFLTVFRFFTFIDARVKREGWDVELKLRADATYAGIAKAATGGRPEPPTGRVSALVGAIASLVMLTASGAARAEPLADAAGGGGAQRALARQSFPWYDAEHDRFRPLLRPAVPPRRFPPASSAAPGRGAVARGDADGRSRSPPGTAPVPGSTGSGRVVPILMVTLLLAVILAAIFLLLRNGLGETVRTRRVRAMGQAVVEVDEQRLAALPAGSRRGGGDLLSLAAVHAEQGEFARAIVCLHAWQLLELDRHGRLALARGKTTGRYAAEVAAAAPALAPLFRRSSRLFEDAFFGDLPVSRADFLAVWNERDRLAAAGRTPGD